MATNNNGLATASDINKKCLNAFSSSKYDLTKCPTKSEIESAINCITISGYQTNQLVKYSDILNDDLEIPIKVKVFNDKRTKTNSLTIRAYYGTSTTSIPYEIGSVSIGEVAKNSWSDEKTLWVTIPSTLSSQYYFNLGCGETGAKQTWYWNYGSTSGWTAYGGNNAKTGYTASFEVQPISPGSSSSRSLLGSYNYSGTKIDKIYFRIT